LGGDDRAFYEPPASGKTAGRKSKRNKRNRQLRSEVNKSYISDLLDNFASEYGWPLSLTVSHTFYQLRKLSEAMDERRSNDRVLFCHMVRAAHNSDSSEFKRYVETLKPHYMERRGKRRGNRKSENFPVGIVHKRV
jgi:hypothetical protein